MISHSFRHKKRVVIQLVACAGLFAAMDGCRTNEVPKQHIAPNEPIAKRHLGPDYKIDIDALNNLFGKAHRVAPLLKNPDGSLLQQNTLNFVTRPQPSADTNSFPARITRVEDAFQIHIALDAQKSHEAPTHLFGKVNLVPYGDGTNVVDAAGQSHFGDEAVAEYFKPDDIGFAIKHHRPLHRVLGDSGPDESKDEIKLQDTHIEVVVGVKRDGRDAVITVNNPQNYQEGGFGDEDSTGDYPMIFTRPSFPAYVSAPVRKQLLDNIRTMVVGFNTVSEFPDNYDGGDPLSAYDPEKIKLFVKMMVQAVGGNAEARAFFHLKENFMYCAEMAFTATTAGLLVPLNRETMLGLGVSDAEWDAFAREVALHNLHNPTTPSYFVRNNANHKIGFVQLAALDSLKSLKPMPQYSRTPEREFGKLAFKPMTMTDMIEGFMQLYFPRQQLGEKIAPAQAKVLAMMKPGLLEMLDVSPTSAAGTAASKLYDEIVGVVGKQYSDYAEFRRNLNPLMEKAQAMTAPQGGRGLFTPPSLFHLALRGYKRDQSLIGLEYVGHGLHFSVVKL